jgi:Fe-S cluster assembly ATP-binding protein
MKHSFIARNGDVPIGGFVKKLKDAQKRLGIPDDWLGRGMNAGFSGGEKKRLMFLNLLLSEPRRALLDEPDSGTDEAARKTFGEIIAEMKSSSFLIISHQDAFFAATETTTMKKGEIK